eukprot:Nitzschia sp. Nitz4//scaffold78_size91513//52236//52641//NITZ4_004930-RA/size91513-snap-gene-0.123-mRNA-1//1//CDS//3329558133//1107//frame0
MGGGGWYYVPKVWTPYGGWWANPAQWKRNTAMAGVGIAVLFGMMFTVSAQRERRPIPPFKHIPSQMWAKHAAIDDPSLKK